MLTNVAGIKFRPAGTIYEYDAGEIAWKRGDRVIVESDRGPSLATVAVPAQRRPVADLLRRILRRANAEDEASVGKHAAREREAYLFAKERIRAKKLPMKLTRVEYASGGNKAIVYFSSEERVDFRDLARELSTRLRGRIELRQIGARDEAKMLGGIGACGRELCCSTWLPAFIPVSIKMAKDQGLPLNPSKVSGQCGRLKCCLVYEHDIYKELKKTLPKAGKRVTTPAGDGKVVELDVLRQRVRVLFDEGGYEVFPGDVVRQIGPPQRAPDKDDEE
jgi:cell fate regulator YaaT (PSP1 superfamily)